MTDMVEKAWHDLDWVVQRNQIPSAVAETDSYHEPPLHVHALHRGQGTAMVESSSSGVSHALPAGEEHAYTAHIRRAGRMDASGEAAAPRV